MKASYGLAALSPAHLYIHGWRQDQHAFKSLAVITAEVLDIAGQQMGGAGTDGGQEDWAVALRQIEAWGVERLRWSGRDDFHGCTKLLQVFALLCSGEVATGFLHRVGRGNECHATQLEELPEPGVVPVGGGEQDIGIQEDPIHALGLGRVVVRNGVRVEA